MNALKFALLTATIFIFTSQLTAQKKGHGGHHPHYKKQHIVVRQSAYRPNKVFVYHPYWRPNYNYNRRWVFFPKYNLYWDNWRNHYVFYNGTVWLSQPTAPPIIVNVNLENEKNAELKPEDDDVDDVYQNNPKHKEEIKPE